MGAVHTNAFTEKFYVSPLPRFRKENLILRDEPVSYSDDKTEHGYSLSYVPITGEKLKPVISFRARPMPGCCGVLMVYYLRPSNVPDAKEAEELYKDTLKAICYAAKAADYGMVCMSLLATSVSAMNILLAEGFTEDRFINGKTGNEVVLLHKDLKQAVPARQKFTCE